MEKNISSDEIKKNVSLPEYQKIIHLTSNMNVEVAEKIASVSQKIFERNREAYRILANK